METNRPQRREILSLKRTQMKIVALVAVPLIVICVILSVVQTYFFVSTIHNYAIPPTLLNEIIFMACMIGLIVLLFMLPVCASIAVWVSHRVVGPMGRVAREMKNISDGKLAGGFTLREGDELTFVGTAMAEMKQSLRDRVVAIEEARRTMAECADRVAGGDAAAMNDLRKQEGRLKSIVDGFVLRNEPAPPAEPEPVGRPQPAATE